MKPRLPTLWWMTDEIRTPDPRPVLARLARGSAVILRHYAAAARVDLAMDVATLCRRYGLVLMIGGDWRLAAKVRACGLHLPEHQARRGPASGARLWLRRRLLTAAAHGSRGINRAQVLGADAALLSPIFASQSHAGAGGLGLARAGLILRSARLPVMALGGVKLPQAHGLRSRGFAGIAGISFIDGN